jgi:hypothetical protein
MAVDDAVGAIVKALTDTGRMSNTLFVFLSDHGLLMGEHHLFPWKGVPYRMSASIPMLLRWDGHVRPDSTNRRLVLNIDLAVTIANAAGASMSTEGLDLLGPERRDGFPSKGRGDSASTASPTTLRTAATAPGTGYTFSTRRVNRSSIPMKRIPTSCRISPVVRDTAPASLRCALRHKPRARPFRLNSPGHEPGVRLRSTSPVARRPRLRGPDEVAPRRPVGRHARYTLPAV